MGVVDALDSTSLQQSVNQIFGKCYSELARKCQLERSS